MTVSPYQRHRHSLPAPLWRKIQFLALLFVPLTLLVACIQDQKPPARFIIENVLYGVAARSPTDVWAVGSMSSASFRNHVLIEHWNGKEWQVIPSSSAGILSGVVAVAANDVWAVGHVNDLPLILHWDGATWSQVQSPSSTSPGALSGVAAVSAHDVWAVGRTNQFSPLILHWNGAGWSTVPLEAPPAFRVGSLGVVRALSPTSVWAVGWYSKESSAQYTLAEHWDGQSWQYIPTPDYAQDPRILGNATFADLTALSDGTLWAVGESDLSSVSPPRTLVEQWTGSHWQSVDTPAPASPASSYPETIFASDAHNLWIAGYWYSPKTYTNAPLLLHGDGQSWQIATPPSLPPSSVFFAGTAVTANECWMVGSSGEAVSPAPSNGAFESQTLIEYWDGTTWSLVPSPNPGQRIPPLGQA